MNEDLDIPMTTQEVEEILQEADINRDGKISYEGKKKKKKIYYFSC